MTTLPAFNNVGHVSAVHSLIVDAEFPAGYLPPLRHALLVNRPDLPPLTVEAHSHLSTSEVRCVTLGPPAGLRRGLFFNILKARRLREVGLIGGIYSGPHFRPQVPCR